MMKRGQTAINKSLNLGVLALAGLLGSGLLFLGISTIVQDLRLDKEGVVTFAKIANNQEFIDDNGQKRHQIQYQFIVDDNLYTYADSTGRQNLWHSISKEEWNSLRETNQIKIVYIPDNPWINRPLGKNSAIDSYAAVCAGTGLISLLCFIATNRLISRKKIINLIKEMLRRIQREGGNSNFVTFVADAEKNYFIQFASEAGATRLYGEAVSNEFLEPQYALNTNQMAHLLSLGWAPPAGGYVNYNYEWHTTTNEDRRRIAKKVVQTFIEVYGVTPDETMDVNLVLQ
jgi:hypothetical protein